MERKGNKRGGAERKKRREKKKKYGEVCGLGCLHSPEILPLPKTLINYRRKKSN